MALLLLGTVFTTIAGGTILPEDLPEQVRERWQSKRGVTKPVSSITPPPPVPLPPDPLLDDHPTLDELNRRYAERVLRESGGNKTRAAEALGIDRKTLSRLLRESRERSWRFRREFSRP